MDLEPLKAQLLALGVRVATFANDRGGTALQFLPTYSDHKAIALAYDSYSVNFYGVKDERTIEAIYAYTKAFFMFHRGAF